MTRASGENAYDFLGEVALGRGPLALTGEAGAGRVCVTLRGPAAQGELRRALGPQLALVETADGLRIEFAAERLREIAGSSSPLARAVAAAALARRAPPREPRILGVVNVTPDSFSDGGDFADPGRAVEHGLALLAEGAHGLDIGGESARPGSQPVDLDEERRRVLPVIRGLARETRALLSVDTTKSRVAAEALDLGAGLINDVSAGRFDPGMFPLAAARGCELALMHMQGTPLDMQLSPTYGDVVAEVAQFLRERAAAAWGAGVAPEKLWIDPGLGFGKRLEHNLALLARLGELRSLGLSLLVGPSRKSFIEHVRVRALGERAGPPPEARERLGGSVAAAVSCALSGAELLRVHDVRVMAEALRVAVAIRDA